MSSPGKSPWNLVPARRPLIDDWNGIAKADDSAHLPNPTTMLSAAEYNTGCAVSLAYGRMTPNLVVAVTGGTTPSVSSFVCMVDLVGPPGSTSPAVPMTITRNGVGDVSITLPANTLPPSVVSPVAALNSSTAGMIAAQTITNGVRVRSFAISGLSAVATDLDFTVMVW